jgi:Mn2+/Fe2+ NRAMP family transporter
MRTAGRRHPARLPEVNSTILVPFGGPWVRRLLAFLGPGYLVSVGYMDPGNWATDVAGGSKFGYTLLSVILLSNLMAILLQARLPSWARRLLTRGIAVVPVVIVTALYGERGTSQLLVFSQVVLSMQLPFAVIPLERFVSDRRKIGQFAISRSVAAVAWIVAAIIVALNVKLLFETFFG